MVRVFGREGRNAKGPIAEPRAKRAGDKKGPGALPPLAPKTRSARLLCTRNLRPLPQPFDDMPAEGALRRIVVGDADLSDVDGEPDVPERGDHLVARVLT